MAPFGKGRATLIDQTVRNTREIDASQLMLSDPGLLKRLVSFLTEVAGEMAIPGKIKAVPYKLLIYPTGGFFAEHQDSEKLPGMFGTLLIGLPSAHQGGAIRIDPGEGEPVVVDFAENNAADFPAVAFLADRKHEILPVTGGYRVVLVYNLVYASGQPPDHVDVEAVAQDLTLTLTEIGEDEDPMVLALDHQYTDTNFSSAQLKGNDRVRVAALRRAATLAGMEIRVGLIEETVSAEWLNGEAFGQGYGSGYYGGYTDDEEGDPEHFDEVEVGDPLVEELYMGDWLDEDGPQLGQLQLRHTEILTGPGQQREEPIEWSVEGYMGNWGMTADYVYRHAGVVIWHPSATPRLLERLPLDGRVSWTLNWCHQLASSPQDDGLRQRTEVLLSTVEQALSGTYTVPSDPAAIAELLAILGRYSGQPTELLRRWEPILERLFTGVPPGLWGPLATTFGWEAVDRVFRSVGVREPGWPGAEDMTRLSKLIEATRILAEGQDEGHHRLAHSQLLRLPDYLHVQSPQGKVAREVIAGLLNLTRLMVPDEQWIRRVGAYLLRPIDDATHLHHALGEELIHDKCPDNPLYAHLYQSTLDNLRQRLQREPQPFADWARPLPRNVKEPGGRYREVLAFLVDPQTESFRYQAPQAARNELTNYLNRNDLDVDQHTIRTRPAHTLVLTKNDLSYQRAVKLHEKNKILLTRLEAVESTNPQTEFVRALAQAALGKGDEREDVRQALVLYGTYFADLAAGRPPRSQAISVSVDALLDTWEAQLDRRYQAGTDAEYIPDLYPTLDHLSHDAFVAVAAELE